MRNAAFAALTLAVFVLALGCNDSTNTGGPGPSGDPRPGDNATGGDSGPGDTLTGDPIPGDPTPGDSMTGDSAPGDSMAGDSAPLPTTCNPGDNGATRCNTAADGDSIVEQCDGSSWSEFQNCSDSGLICAEVPNVTGFARCEVPTVYVALGESCNGTTIQCTQNLGLVCAGTPMACRTDCSADAGACSGSEYCDAGACIDLVATGLPCPGGSAEAACSELSDECVAIGNGVAAECRPICPSNRIGEVGTADSSTSCGAGFTCARNNQPTSSLEYEFGATAGSGGPVLCDPSADQCATLAGAGYTCESLYVGIDASGPSVIQEHVCAIDCGSVDTCGIGPGPGYRCERLPESIDLSDGTLIFTKACARPPGVCSRLAPLLGDLSPAAVEAAVTDSGSGAVLLSEMCDRPTFFMGDATQIEIAGSPIQCEQLAGSQLCAIAGSCDAATAIASCQPIPRGYLASEIATCSGNGDCNVDAPGNYVCEQGTCLYPCSLSSDCPYFSRGETCDTTSGFCFFNGEPSPEENPIACSDDIECAPYGMACDSALVTTGDVCAVLMTACALACSVDPDEPELVCPVGMTCEHLPTPGPVDPYYLTAELQGEPGTSTGTFKECPNDDPPGNRECSGNYYCQDFPGAGKYCVWQKKFCQ